MDAYGQEGVADPCTRPQGNESNDYEQHVAVSPAEAFIGADAMALLAAVGVIMNLRATGGTVHGSFYSSS